MGSAGRTSFKRPSTSSSQLLHSKGQLQTRARTARQCFATTATTALRGTGMSSEMIIPTASSATRMCLPTTATSVERSSGSTQKTFRTRRSIGTKPVSSATSVEPVLWTSSLVPRRTESTAAPAMTPSLPLDVTDVETYSRLV